MTTRAVSYSRVSSDEQAEKGYSLPQQDKILARGIRERHYELVQHFREDYTGTVANRPEMSRILDLARARAFDVLLCVNMGRFARGNRPRYILEDELTACGIRVEFEEEQFADNEDGELQKDIKGSIEGWEGRRIRKRTMRGRREKAERKQVSPTGARPYGYHCISAAQAAAIPEYYGRSGELLINDPEAAIVREVFQRAAAGSTLRVIARDLQSRGVPTIRNSTHWSYTTLRAIIQNTSYHGERTLYRRQSQRLDEVSPSGRQKQAIRFRPSSEHLLVPCPAIVSRDLWDRANAAIALNKPRQLNQDLWPLTGIVFCGHCTGKRGQPLRCHGIPSGSGNRSYGCQSATRPDMQSCRTRYSAETLEAAAIDALNFFAQPGKLAEQRRAELEAQLAATGSIASRIAGLQRDLTTLDTEERNVSRLIKAGVAEHIWKEDLEAIHTRRTATQAALAELEHHSVRLPSPEQIAEGAEQIARAIRALLDQARTDPGKVRDALQCLRITIYRDRDPVIEAL